MAARSNGSATIQIAHVSIPVKLFTATSENSVSFNMLHPRKIGAKKAKCGSRVKQLLLCEREQKAIERKDTVHGYEYSPEKFVTFTNGELKAIELEGDPDTIRIAEVVPADSVPLTHVRKTIYLGPDKGAAHAYRLIAVALERAKLVAVGQVGGQRRDELVIVRPHEGGLALHELFYANEVRAFSELELDADLTLSSHELGLAEKVLSGMLVPRFDADRFTDEAAARIKEAVARKVDGKEIVVPKPATADKKLDLVEQLERSLEAPGPRKTHSWRDIRREPVSGARRAV